MDMHRAGIAILSGIFFVAGAVAQTQAGAQAGAQASGQASVREGLTGAQASGNESAGSNASARTSNTGASLAKGTAVNATLDKSVDSRKAKEGEIVTARTTQAVKENGRTVLPRGTKLVGHVTHASARARGDSESALAIQFDRAILKHGKKMPVDLNIQALASARTAASMAGDDMDMMGSTGTYAGGATSAVGGGLGGEAPVAGGAVGAVTNTAANAGSVAGGALGAAVNSTAGISGAANGAPRGLNAAGQLASDSRGVFGLHGLSLASAGANATQGSLITSSGKSVRLESGTRMLLVSRAGADEKHPSKSAQPSSKSGRSRARE
jgi:hypothetical protein